MNSEILPVAVARAFSSDSLASTRRPYFDRNAALILAVKVLSTGISANLEKHHRVKYLAVTKP